MRGGVSSLAQAIQPGASAANGKVVVAPSNADFVGIFDPADGSFQLFDISAQLSSDWQSIGAAPAADGKTIFAPFFVVSVGILDPADDSFQLVDISAQLSSDWKFNGAAPAANGKVVFAPFFADNVGVFDPASVSFHSKIAFVPYDADCAAAAAAAAAASSQVSSSAAESSQVIDISAQLSSDFKFQGADPAAKGKIIFAPFFADSVDLRSC